VRRRREDVDWIDEVNEEDVNSGCVPMPACVADDDDELTKQSVSIGLIRVAKEDEEDQHSSNECWNKTDPAVTRIE